MSDDQSLGRQVCFALYAASRAVTQAYRSALEPLGLTYPQYLVMLVLWERGALTVKELGTALELDSGTLSPLLKRLEAAGYVVRQRSTKDERAVEIHLTDTGTSLRERAAAVPGMLLRSTGMTTEELVALRCDLVRLADSVSAHPLGEQQ
jgi:DNA-binding MarR family transcriptional regulator